ncbi:fibronectin type III domain-containing protein 11-like [Pempheris klunzingeri]|uniref:fibronectin type III domain-containing protein 11-like n=1 Tax=Pempheris klunzingeri TaxID=3127111 RepID=UPI003980665F
MNEVKLARTNSDECRVQEVKTQKDTLLDLCNQILRLLNTRLSDKSILVLQEELRFMQRCSYYLEIQREDLLPTVDQNQQTLHLSDSMVWSLIDQQKLQRTMTQANTQVRLLLALLGMLYEEIIRGCQELEAFIVEYYQGLVDSDMAASMQQKLQKTHQYMSDFQNRLTRNLGPLDLQNRLIPNTCNFPLPHLSASLTIKMPVIFDRFKSCVSSNTAYLFWDVVDEQSKEPTQQFEIHGRSLHPTIPEHGQLTVTTSQSYNIQVNNLTPDMHYQFSVKRVDAVNLVYGLWIDTIILKTLDISK